VYVKLTTCETNLGRSLRSRLVSWFNNWRHELHDRLTILAEKWIDEQKMYITWYLEQNLY
jgi:hypothetical protein